MKYQLKTILGLNCIIIKYELFNLLIISAITVLHEDPLVAIKIFLYLDAFWAME